jgi:hypothetical protein
VIPVPVIIPIGAINYNQGYQYGYAQGHYEGWNNFPYDDTADPYWNLRPFAFQQGFLAGYAVGYARGSAGRP